MAQYCRYNSKTIICPGVKYTGTPAFRYDKVEQPSADGCTHGGALRCAFLLHLTGLHIVSGNHGGDVMRLDGMIWGGVHAHHVPRVRRRGDGERKHNK